MTFRVLCRVVNLSALLFPMASSLLVGCSRGPVPVNIHGVNYSGEPFSYVLIDPANIENKGGGELIDAYSAGGTMCCYELPQKWLAGMKVKVNFKYWTGKFDDHTLLQSQDWTIVDVPRYVDGRPEELWVLRRSDGTMELVVSDVQPDHENWPGAIKGWPVPSLEFQRKIWDKYIQVQRDYFENYEASITRFRVLPDEAAKEAWEVAAEYDRRSIEEFTGSDDPKYRAKLVRDYNEGLERTRTELHRLQKERP